MRFRRLSMGRRVHLFKRAFQQELTVTNSGLTNYAPAFSIDQLPNYTEFSNLFDQYKIAAIKIRFIYSSNVEDNAGTHPLPILYTVVDRDDNTALSQVTDYMQYETMKQKRLDRPVSIYVKHPLAATALYSGAFTSYGQYSGWIDMTSTGVQYYACKFGVDALDNLTGTTLGKLKVFYTLYIKCRDVR